jgi:predicted nuclease of predicted toxin-antitoxin system
MMQFLIDEQLPGSLANFIRRKGFSCLHIQTLKSGSKISDSEICTKSVIEQWVVITKDIDFLDRYIIKKEPYKLIYITTGNIQNNLLLFLFDRYLNQIVELLKDYNVIEFGTEEMKVLY